MECETRQCPAIESANMTFFHPNSDGTTDFCKGLPASAMALQVTSSRATRFVLQSLDFIAIFFSSTPEGRMRVATFSTPTARMSLAVF